MKVLLCGYHEAGYRALRTLIAREHEVFVATHPTPAEIPSLAAFAQWVGIGFVDGEVDQVGAAAGSFRPEIILSVYYRHILPVRVLEMAPRGAFNFHPALLPRHRGSYSAPWAIIEGDRTTGATCHRMIERVDAGGIVDTLPVSVEMNDTGMSLYYKLVDAVVALFEQVVRQAECGPLETRPQQGPASFHLRKIPCDGVIDPAWARDRIERFIRALNFPPWPPAAAVIDGVRHPVRNIEEYDEVLAEVGGPVAGT